MIYPKHPTLWDRHICGETARGGARGVNGSASMVALFACGKGSAAPWKEKNGVAVLRTACNLPPERNPFLVLFGETSRSETHTAGNHSHHRVQNQTSGHKASARPISQP